MKWLYRIIIFCAVIGIMFTVMGVKESKGTSKEAIDMASVDWSTLKKGDHVTFTVNAVWDCLYTETTTQSTYGVTTNEYESGRVYVIPDLYYNSAERYYDVNHYICYKVTNSQDYNTLERIMKETNEWYFDETGTIQLGRTTYQIDGIVKEMTREEKDFMTEYLLDYCVLEERELGDVMCPYVIEKVNQTATKTKMKIGITADIITVILIVVAIILAKKENAKFAKNTYMGINSTGSTDIYGGPDYGGNNFGGYNYGAPNQTYQGYHQGAEEQKTDFEPWQPYQ